MKLTKRILSLCLALAMLLTVATFPAFAEEYTPKTIGLEASVRSSHARYDGALFLARPSDDVYVNDSLTIADNQTITIPANVYRGGSGAKIYLTSDTSNSDTIAQITGFEVIYGQNAADMWHKAYVKVDENGAISGFYSDATFATTKDITFTTAGTYLFGIQNYVDATGTLQNLKKISVSWDQFNNRDNSYMWAVNVKDPANQLVTAPNNADYDITSGTAIALGTNLIQGSAAVTATEGNLAYTEDIVPEGLTVDTRASSSDMDKNFTITKADNTATIIGPASGLRIDFTDISYVDSLVIKRYEWDADFKYDVYGSLDGETWYLIGDANRLGVRSGDSTYTISVDAVVKHLRVYYRDEVAACGYVTYNISAITGQIGVQKKAGGEETTTVEVTFIDQTFLNPKDDVIVETGIGSTVTIPDAYATGYKFYANEDCTEEITDLATRTFNENTTIYVKAETTTPDPEDPDTPVDREPQTITLVPNAAGDKFTLPEGIDEVIIGDTIVIPYGKGQNKTTPTPESALLTINGAKCALQGLWQHSPVIFGEIGGVIYTDTGSNPCANAYLCSHNDHFASGHTPATSTWAGSLSFEITEPGTYRASSHYFQSWDETTQTYCVNYITKDPETGWNKQTEIMEPFTVVDPDAPQTITLVPNAAGDKFTLPEGITEVRIGDTIIIPYGKGGGSDTPESSLLTINGTKCALQPLWQDSLFIYGTIGGSSYTDKIDSCYISGRGVKDGSEVDCSRIANPATNAKTGWATALKFTIVEAGTYYASNFFFQSQNTSTGKYDVTFKTTDPETGWNKQTEIMEPFTVVDPTVDNDFAVKGESGTVLIPEITDDVLATLPSSFKDGGKNYVAKSWKMNGVAIDYLALKALTADDVTGDIVPVLVEVPFDVDLLNAKATPTGDDDRFGENFPTEDGSDTYYTNGLYIQGAQIRFPEGTTTAGLRFVNVVDRTLEKALEALAEAETISGLDHGTLAIGMPIGDTTYDNLGLTVDNCGEPNPGVNNKGNKIYKDANLFNDEYYKYTLCVTGFQPAQYELPVYVRPYITFTYGNETIYLYGEQYKTNYKAVVKLAKDSDTLTPEQESFCDKILD